MGNYQIVVSEPWDFDGANGTNQIIGNIEMISNETLVFLSDKLVIFHDIKGRTFLLKTRYKNDTFIHHDKHAVTVAGGLLEMEDYKGIDEAYLESKSKYVFIGSLIPISG